jgi:hypothetical protein
MGRREEIVKEMTPKLGCWKGMPDAYIITKKGHIKGRNSCEERENQGSVIEISATTRPS